MQAVLVALFWVAMLFAQTQVAVLVVEGVAAAAVAGVVVVVVVVVAAAAAAAAVIGVGAAGWVAHEKQNPKNRPPKP